MVSGYCGTTGSPGDAFVAVDELSFLGQRLDHLTVGLLLYSLVPNLLLLRLGEDMDGTLRV
jgi:hypothetical protein